jgi:hypothetical protein
MKKDDCSGDAAMQKPGDMNTNMCAGKQNNLSGLRGIVSCETCRKLKEGNMHLPDGSILNNVRVCIDKRCEPGLNTFYRPKAVSA